MVSAFNAGLSGLYAASLRVSVAGENIANVRSLGAKDAADTTGYRPLRVEQLSDGSGGTRAVIQAIDPPSLPSFEPDHPDADASGIVPRPNISLERQFVDMLIGQRSFEANLETIRTADEMLGALLDIKS